MLDDRQSVGVSFRTPITNGLEEEREYAAYAQGRVGIRPQLTVTFRQVDGTSYSFAYSHLYRMTSETESGGFVVEFSQHRISVQGRNLTQLFRYLCDHKVHTIQAMSPTQGMGLEDGQPMVTQIRVQDVPL